MKKWFSEGTVGVLLLLAAPVVFLLVEGLDHQVANLLLVLLAVIGLLLAFNWLVRTCFDAWWKRLAVVFLSLLGGSLLASQLEFQGFSGELVPQFRWKSKRSERALQQTDLASVNPTVPDRNASSLAQEGPLKATVSVVKFSQFMGENRDGRVDGIKLATDWKTQAPVKIWEIDLGAAWSGFAVANGLAVTQEQFEGKDAVSAFDLLSGNLVWRSLTDRQHYHPLGGAGPRATPTIYRDSVVSQSSTGIVTSVDLKTGKLKWSVDLLAKAGIDQASAEAAVTWGRSGSPLIISDLVVVPLGAGIKGRVSSDAATLIALDFESGEEKWRVGESQISYASPALITIGGQEQIVIVNEADVTGHDIKTGALLWKTDWPGATNGGASVSQATRLDEQHLLLSKGYGGGAKVIKFVAPFSAAASLEQLWNDTSVMKTKFMSPVVLGEYVYGLSDGILECIRWRDGKRMWKDGREGRLGHGQLLLVEDQLLCCSEDGRLVLTNATPTKPEKYQSISVLDGVTWNPLALAGEYVLMRNAEKGVCFRVPLRF